MSSRLSVTTGASRTRDALTGVLYALLLFLPAFAVCRSAPSIVADPDVWWHLRAADWMVAHGTVPRVDLFSAARGPGPSFFGCVNKSGTVPFAGGAAARDTEFRTDSVPWVDYSWAAELVIRCFYRAFGLRGLVAFTMLMLLLIVLAFHLLVRSMQTNLPLTATLTIAAAIGIQCVAMPRPWLFTILFFLLELLILLKAQRTSRATVRFAPWAPSGSHPRRLLLLVPLFCLWANMHIQFTFGLIVLALAVIESLLGTVPIFAPAKMGLSPLSPQTPVSFRWMLSIFVLCCGATLLNPYHVRLYATAVQLLGQTALWNLISEVQALPFRCITDWIVLAAALGGAAATVPIFAPGTVPVFAGPPRSGEAKMGLSPSPSAAHAARRPLPLLLASLFPLAVYFSFRSQRDAWMVLFVGLSLVAGASRGLRLPPWRISLRSCLGAAVLVAALVVGSFRSLDEKELRAEIAKSYPAAAVNYLQRGSYEGPFYNTFYWGGYLIYHYPEHPVSMDGRTLIHGAARVLHSGEMERGEEGWQSDPELNAARLVLLPRTAALTLLMRLDARFHVLYEDDVAVVFVPR